MLHTISKEIKQNYNPEHLDSVEEQLEDLINSPNLEDPSWLMAVFNYAGWLLHHHTKDLNNTDSDEQATDNNTNITEEVSTNVFYSVAEVKNKKHFGLLTKEQAMECYNINEESDFYESVTDAEKFARTLLSEGADKKVYALIEYNRNEEKFKPLREFTS